MLLMPTFRSKFLSLSSIRLLELGLRVENIYDPHRIDPARMNPPQEKENANDGEFTHKMRS
jgi:hypothetical protein